MFRRASMLLAALVLVAAAQATVAASPKDERDIRAVYAKLATAYKSVDTKGIAAIAAPGFTYTGMDGRAQTLDALLSALKQQQAQGVRIANMAVKIDRITVKGSMATVSNHGSTTATRKGPDGKTHTIKSEDTSVDTLVRTAKGWLFKTVKVTSQKMTMDGQPMTGMGAPPPRRRTPGQ